MTWRHYFGAAHAVCMLAVDTLRADLDRAGALLEGASDLWERGALEADRQLHAEGCDAFPFSGYFWHSDRVLELIGALRGDVEQLRRDRSRERSHAN